MINLTTDIYQSTVLVFSIQIQEFALLELYL